MSKKRLDCHVDTFIIERLEDELWNTNGETTKYSIAIEKLIDETEKVSDDCSYMLRLIHELTDLYDGHVFEMQQKAYKVGFKDGLNIKNVF